MQRYKKYLSCLLICTIFQTGCSTVTTQSTATPEKSSSSRKVVRPSEGADTFVSVVSSVLGVGAILFLFSKREEESSR